jgi:hypothetical protein
VARLLFLYVGVLMKLNLVLSLLCALLFASLPSNAQQGLEARL